MKFLKTPIRTIIFFRTNQSFRGVILPLFLILLLVSSCATQPEDFEYNVTFSSPDTSAIYYTDTLNATGESLGPETVEFIGKITSNQEIKRIKFEIRNNSFELVYDETFDDVEGLYDYIIETEFQTDIAGVYDVYLTITFNEGEGTFVKVWQSNDLTFEYRDIDNNEGGENNDN